MRPTFQFIALASTSGATLLAPAAARAHPGHLAEVAGHGHWLGAAAIGAAIAIGLFQGLKGKDNKADPSESEADAEADDLPEDELQEA